jgi:hypothetical protein
MEMIMGWLLVCVVMVGERETGGPEPGGQGRDGASSGDLDGSAETIKITAGDYSLIPEGGWLGMVNEDNAVPQLHITRIRARLRREGGGAKVSSQDPV